MTLKTTDAHAAILRKLSATRKLQNWTRKAVVGTGSKVIFDTAQEAKEYGLNAGLIHTFDFNEVDMFEALSHLAFEFRYNIVSDDMEMRHEALTKGNWIAVTKKSKELAMLSRALHSICFVVKSETERHEGEKYKYFWIDQIPNNQWGKTTDTIIGNLGSLVVEYGNGEIPAVHPLREFLDEVRKHRKTLDTNQVNDCKRLASTWLNEIPHLRPVNEELGNAASLNIAGGLGYRLLESEKPTGYRPMAQREMVFLASPQSWKIGKTAAMVSLVPPSLTNRVLENFTLDSEQKMHRAIKGKFFVIADDLSGFTSKQGEQWKSFQTQTRPSVDDKYKNIKDFPRTDWIAGTANDMFVPPNNALSARVVVCEVDAIKESKAIPARQRGKDIAQWFDELRLALFVGAVTLAEEDIDIEVPEHLWDTRRDAIESVMSQNDDLRAAIKEFIGERCDEFNYYFQMRDLLHELGFLTHQLGDDKGKAIARDFTILEEIELAYRVMLGKNMPEYRAVVAILEGLGWRQKRHQTKDGQIRCIAPTTDKSYRPWNA